MTETFAFIDLGSGDRGLADCIAGLNNTKWKGKVVRGNILNCSRQEKYLKFYPPGRNWQSCGGELIDIIYSQQQINQLAISVLSVQMKLQQAKESFMERLARERREKESGGLSLVSYSFYHWLLF